jgi:cyclase
MKGWIFLLTLLLLPLAAPADPTHDRKPDDIFTLQKLSDSVYALFGRGGNIGFFVGPEAVVMIDSQYNEIAPGIAAQIKSVTDKPVKYLINTHHHPDHVGGNEYFLPFSIIIAQDNVRRRMLSSPQDILKQYPPLLEEAKKKGDQHAIDFYTEQIDWAKKVKIDQIAAPFMTFDSEFRIYLGGETIQVWHTPPAHTDGDSVIYFEKASVVHMGDLLFNKVIPFIDVDGGGSARGYLTALDKVLSRIPANVKVIPGHGEITDIAGIKLFRQFIQDINDLAQKAKSAGKSREDFLKEADLPAYKDWNGYADRFKDCAGSAYDEAK